jgi:uncharacterized protein
MSARQKIRVLILSGANNHDWHLSAPFCWLLLGKSGRFTATVTTQPSETLEQADGLKDVDLMFMDYNGPAWSAAAQRNFESAVRGGMGLVVLHAADNAFVGWTEFEKMVGLLWRDGAGHGRFHEFPVTIVDKDHPITSGLSNFRTTDELYHNLQNPRGVPCRVLATALSSSDSGGSGKAEPVMAVLEYGKGRVFHMVLGHVWPVEGAPNMVAFENEGFQKGLVRGCEWAATGAVAAV